jgi:hypothetical protein
MIIMVDAVAERLRRILFIKKYSKLTYDYSLMKLISKFQECGFKSHQRRFLA